MVRGFVQYLQDGTKIENSFLDLATFSFRPMRLKIRYEVYRLLS